MRTFKLLALGYIAILVTVGLTHEYENTAAAAPAATTDTDLSGSVMASLVLHQAATNGVGPVMLAIATPSVTALTVDSEPHDAHIAAYYEQAEDHDAHVREYYSQNSASADAEETDAEVMTFTVAEVELGSDLHGEGEIEVVDLDEVSGSEIPGFEMVVGETEQVELTEDDFAPELSATVVASVRPGLEQVTFSETRASELLGWQ